MKKIACAPLRHLQTLEPYRTGTPIEWVERELGISNVIKLASNENPFGPSPRVFAALGKEMEKIRLYPEGGSPFLREALARALGVGLDRLVVGNGSNELLILLSRIFLQPNDRVLTSAQSFVVYEQAARLARAAFDTVPMVGHTYNLAAMASAIVARTKMIFIANPNNPTGTAVRPRALLDFMKRVPEGCLVVLDEAYREYMEDAFQPASVAWSRRFPNLVLARTFSKAYGLAGLRVGYLIAHPQITDVLHRVRDPFNVNRLAQTAALAALGDHAYLRRTVQSVLRERSRVSRRLSQSGCEVAASQANFIFFRCPEPGKLGPGKDLPVYLLQQGVIVRPFPNGWVRVTIGKAEENRRFLSNLMAWRQAGRSRREATK
jgi:histidinol-phosphate aminotransferase